MAHDEQQAEQTSGTATGATRRTVLAAGAGALVALAGASSAAPASAAPSGPGAEVGTARESAAASEGGVECVADLR